jgi:cobalt-zinc-cadmium efflux system outer membrane protein
VISKQILVPAVVAAVFAAGARVRAEEAVRVEPTPAEASAPSSRLLLAMNESPRRELLAEVLERNADVAAMEAAARAAAERSPQVSALPDPMAAVTAYLWPPETRVGPQRVMGSLSQKFPWFGKLRLREQVALLGAAQARAKAEAARLRVLTEARRLLDELGFLDAFEQVIRDDRSTLAHYEELSRARYASGVGLEQSIVKIQAEITKDDARFLDIATRRASLAASFNALRDRPEETSVDAGPLPEAAEIRVSLEAVRRLALADRPEIAAADAAIEQSRRMTGLARKEYAPDVTLGLSYTAVGDRTDMAGRLNPPQDNGQDILALSAGVNLPIWRKKLAAGVEEAVDRELQAQEEKLATIDGIGRSLSDLAARIPLTWERLRLFEDVLLVQADQSLRSAEAGYSSGTLHALDLLDAERVLLEVRIQSKRTLADYDIALAQLEGAAAVPVKEISDVR